MPHFPAASIALPAHFKDVMCPGVLLCPKLRPSSAGDLFDSEDSAVSAGFSSHILPHRGMTQTVMSESCLKMFNPKDHAVMARNYRWISQTSLVEIPPPCLSPLLFVAFKGLVVADKQEEAMVWGCDSGHCWEGKGAMPTDEPWHSPWANAGNFHLAGWSNHKMLQPSRRQGRAFPSCTATPGAFSLHISSSASVISKQ